MATKRKGLSKSGKFEIFHGPRSESGAKMAEPFWQTSPDITLATKLLLSRNDANTLSLESKPPTLNQPRCDSRNGTKFPFEVSEVRQCASVYMRAFCFPCPSRGR